MEFGRHAHENRRNRGDQGKAETFDFLGFTHYCTRTRTNGKFTIGRKTTAKKMHQKMEKIKFELKKRMHHKVAETGRWLRSVLQGIYNYAGVPGNFKAMDLMRYRILVAWMRTLRRRSQKARSLTWEKFDLLAKRWLPQPRITHPYPSQRLCVNYPR